MADADDAKQQEEQEEPKAEEGGKKSLTGRLLPWVMTVVVVAICAGAGFGLGRLFAGSSTPEADESVQDEPAETGDLKSDDDSSADSGDVWYYDLEPVVANLNEPSVTRYVSASLTLQMSPEVDQKKGTAFLDQKKPILVNWLTVYLSGLSIEDIRGDKNLKSIQAQILDAFNEKLYPDSKPQIKRVLIKAFPVQ